MSYLTVKAEDVKKEDHIYIGNDFAKNPNHRWARVRKAKRMKNRSSDRIWITAGGLDIWYDPGDMVEIQRFDDVT